MKVEQLLLSGALALVLVAPAATASQSIDQSGTEVFTTEVWKNIELGKDRSSAIWQGLGAVEADDPEMPLHRATANCVGIYEFGPGDRSTAQGRCAYTLQDGEKIFLEWGHDQENPQPHYRWTGGTGRYQGASGGGTYALEQLDNGLSVGTFNGTLKLE